ncbi:MAG: RtcB family protein [Myxococcota bacterium]
MADADIGVWTAEPLPADVKQALMRLARLDDVERIAVMPDAHLSAEVCVGLAVGTRSQLLPAAVGGCIGCGIATRRFDADPARLGSRAPAILSALRRVVPILRHPRRDALSLPEDLADAPLSSPRLEALKGVEGVLQLGTLGRGNHFVELQVDDAGALWLAVHTGSRGLGQAIRSHHEARDGPGLTCIAADSPAGVAYRSDVAWGLRFAAWNRRRIVAAATEVIAEHLGAEPVACSDLDCNHNFVRHETHGAWSGWVHRKGAISARRDEPGIIPGSMGTWTFHVQGRGCVDAMQTSSHGAGRRLSRAQARRRIRVEALRASLHGVYFDQRRARQLVDEAPEAYKPIEAVMRAQRALTRIVRRLRPVLVYKGV